MEADNEPTSPFGTVSTQTSKLQRVRYDKAEKAYLASRSLD
jgi:hypothetical protein